MDDDDWLTTRFDAHRAHLRAVAHRMLGSDSEADDAVQEAWLKLSRADTQEVENVGGWLTTVVARVCLDMLRSRKSRREEPLDPVLPDTIASHEPSALSRVSRNEIRPRPSATASITSPTPVPPFNLTAIAPNDPANAAPIVGVATRAYQGKLRKALSTSLAP